MRIAGRHDDAGRHGGTVARLDAADVVALAEDAGDARVQSEHPAGLEERSLDRVRHRPAPAGGSSESGDVAQCEWEGPETGSGCLG